MQIFILICWYLLTVAGAIMFIPLSLTQFTIWQLLNMWPFVIAFFGAIFIILLGFNVPIVVGHILTRLTGGIDEKKS